jgi:hypothetical protein
MQNIELVFAPQFRALFMVYGNLSLSNRRTFGRRAWLPVSTGAGQFGERAGGGAGAAPAPLELAATDGSEVVVTLAKLEGRSWGLVGARNRSR